ncbi:28S ribosomal protein S9, mitochondrial isoform X2 [Wyeomyia smithii]|uniref:28S ribosomal protein S9, mitochondrial isoform X2 n=1 Tax=Wyeomyia smithii TaxID=174621 RepID=UPI002467C667|nr:28S ribosomal protein S9, mitochondrial isoform X2 [Wyeomyia smithii]
MLNLLKIANRTCGLRFSYSIVELKCHYVTEPISNTPPTARKDKVSKAMKAYLERAKSHNEFMKIQDHEFKLGKRHLANMMGEDPETFTQANIDEAIQYLFPSGLYDKTARPIMKPPEEVIPQRKAAEFDETGRPFHSLFYTARPHYNKLLFDIVENINSLNAFEDRMIQKQLDADVTLKLETSGFEWISKAALEKHLLEILSDAEYDNFVRAMTRLCQLPYSYREKCFINQFRKPMLMKTDSDKIPKPQFDENGKAYITIYECMRKSARADVTVTMPGSGNITINGQDITYFEVTQAREQDFNVNIILVGHTFSFLSFSQK